MGGAIERNLRNECIISLIGNQPVNLVGFHQIQRPRNRDRNCWIVQPDGPLEPGLGCGSGLSGASDTQACLLFVSPLADELIIVI